MKEPLAHILRPQKLEDVAGQQHILGSNTAFRSSLEKGTANSVIFWGPPGCGKTTIAKLLAEHHNRQFLQISAVHDGKKELQVCIQAADTYRRLGNAGALVFVDEIHRWNSAQQDALLPHVETGLICLVGATTENPYHSINKALRSRCWILELHPLDESDMIVVLEKGLAHLHLIADKEVLQAICTIAVGDARRGLSIVERISAFAVDGKIQTQEALQSLGNPELLHDKTGDSHYDVTSAWIKSMRGSDPHASMYWLARMIVGGEDPVFLARRMVIFASEDIGNADLRALPIATACMQSVAMIGFPEAELILGQTCAYLASAPKSNACTLAIRNAVEFVRKTGVAPVPPNIAQHGQNYKNPHHFPHAIVDQPYWPSTLTKQELYQPKKIGDEEIIQKRLLWWEEKRNQTPSK